MYSITVRDHVFVAHSLKGETFGPAQSLHGATYIVDAEFRRAQLDEHNRVIDIGLASHILADTLSTLNYKNLDELTQFRSTNTTTEFLAAYVHGEMTKRLSGIFKGGLKITLRESHVAWGSYERSVD